MQYLQDLLRYTDVLFCEWVLNTTPVDNLREAREPDVYPGAEVGEIKGLGWDRWLTMPPRGPSDTTLKAPAAPPPAAAAATGEAGGEAKRGGGGGTESLVAADAAAVPPAQSERAAALVASSPASMDTSPAITGSSTSTSISSISSTGSSSFAGATRLPGPAKPTVSGRLSRGLKLGWEPVSANNAGYSHGAAANYRHSKTTGGSGGDVGNGGSGDGRRTPPSTPCQVLSIRRPRPLPCRS